MCALEALGVCEVMQVIWTTWLCSTANMLLLSFDILSNPCSLNLILSIIQIQLWELRSDFLCRE